MTAKRKILQNNERKDNDHLKYRGIKQNAYILNSAVFFLVRKLYMLRHLFGAIYVDMRCFGVSWLFSKHKIPHPNQWGSMITTKNTSITECFAATSTFLPNTDSVSFSKPNFEKTSIM